MTKQHKAATEVTVAPLAERSALEEFVFAHWLKGLVLFLVVAVAIVVFQRQEQQKAAANDQSWSSLGDLLAFAEMPGTAADPEALAATAETLTGTLAGPWAEALVAPARAQTGDYDDALTAARAFRAAHPDHPLLALEVAVDEGEFENPISAFETRVGQLEAFKEANPQFFSNPPLPADAPQVALETSAGTIVLGLYSDRAPNHTSNFLERVREGLYDGNKFHRVIPGFMIQSGDPNSVDGDPSTWGSGGGEETQPQEFSELGHFRGYLSMAKRPNEVESSKAQFFITLGAPHQLDGQHTVFGKVLSGMDVVEQIGDGSIAEGTTDRPSEPVTILSARVQ